MGGIVRNQAPFKHIRIRKEFVMKLVEVQSDGASGSSIRRRVVYEIITYSHI
jgi:hypothetical protein